LILLADKLDIHKKFILELDELLFSLHQQDFYQLKSKVASITGSFYELDGINWNKNLTLGLSVQSEENVADNACRFLDVTVTKAETVNVHSKWNIGHKKNRLSNDDITEINVILQPLDVIGNMDELLHFMPIFVALNSGKKRQVEKRQERAGTELPLIHIRCSGIRVFLPCLNGSKSDSPDVVIIRIGELRVTPTAQNNLLRNQILRPDIHSKAYSLGILDIAGSKIEDRQYQLIVKGVTLSTSNWDGIAALINEKTIIQSYDNPAFEWNNLENGPKSPSFKLNNIFKDSTFSFIYAPCMRFKQTLIAGTAMEFNCINDMTIDITMKEMALLSNAGERIGRISKTFQSNDSEPKESELKNDESLQEDEGIHFEKRKTFEKKSLDDSGVESISQSNQKRLWRKKPSLGTGPSEIDIPFEFTFTSSNFNIKCLSGEDNDVVMMVFDTPNVYVTQDKYEKSLNLSLHDLSVTLECKDEKEMIFSTKEGEADSSGIKPSLIRIKYVEKSTKHTDLDIQIKRPIAIELSHGKLIRFQQLSHLLQSHMIVQKKQKLELPINGKLRKFDIIKAYLRGLKTISVGTNQMMVNVKAPEYDFKLSVSNVKGKLRVYERPEKIEASCELVHLLLLNKSKMILHPLSVQAKAKIVQEYWKKDPLIHVNINSNFVKLDVGPDLIKDAVLCRKMFSGVLHGYEAERACNGNSNVDLIPLASTTFQNHTQTTVEHFQDDLRSGAFQFVETSSMRDLPLPYQIQIIDKDVGVICWRYPLPRALHKIKIFPVPFHTSNQVRIVCKIEFYSQLKSQFEEFCDFTLTENETKMLDLKQKRPSAEVWRIKIPRVLLKRDSDSEDEGSDYEFQMHPKVLVACLRIDSYYVSSSIPNLDVFVDVSHIELNVFNKMDKFETMPEVIKHSNLMDDRGKEHEAVKVMLNEVNVLGHFFDENYENFELSGVLGAEVVDYGCGNLVPVVENFKLKALVDLHDSDINLNLITDKMHFRYSPSVGHSLIATKKLWEDNLITCSNKQLILHSKYVVCNNTSYPIGMNQSQTNEMICLMPNTSVLYSFRTDKISQTLQLCICIRGTWTGKTAPIQVHRNDGVEFVKMEENQFFIVTISSITSFQKKITIDGQVAIFNMTKELFRVQYKRYDKDIDTPDKGEAQEFDLEGHKNSSVYGTSLADSQQSIRLRLVTSDKKGYSGEIPLREIVVNNKPWLVKVPSMAKCGFTSFWVRIVRQVVNEQVSRVLVMIWPMFMTKSLLPIDIAAIEQDESFAIIGKGQVRELDVNGTHEDEHELLLKGNFMSAEGKDPTVTLSYKLINRNAFFKIADEYSDVNKAVEMLETKADQPWPSSKDDEVSESLSNFIL